MIDIEEVGRCGAKLLCRPSQRTVVRWRATVTDVEKPSSSCVTKYVCRNYVGNIRVLTVDGCSNTGVRS